MGNEKIDLQFRIIDPTEYRQEIMNLFWEAFQENISIEAFKWKYEEIPYGKMKVWSAWDGRTGKLLATASFCKRRFIHNGKIVTAYQRGDSMVKPGFQRQGIFSNLMRESAKALREEGACFVFGYSNERSAGALKKMDEVKELFLSNVYVFPIGCQNLIMQYVKRPNNLIKAFGKIADGLISIYNHLRGFHRTNGVLMQPVEEFGSLQEKWALEAARNHFIYPHRDREFLRWKAIGVPNEVRKGLFTFWFIRENNKIGYCVLSEDKERNLIKIVDLLCDSGRESLKFCLRAIRGFAIKNKYDLILTNIASDIYDKAFKSTHFIKLKAVRCTFYILRPELFANCDFDNSFWFQSPIDRDTFKY